MAARRTAPPPPEDQPGELTLPRVGRRAKAGTKRAAGKASNDWQQTFLEAYRKTLTVTGACDLVGISPETVKGRRRSDPDFAAAMDSVLDANVDDIEAAVRRKASTDVDSPEGARLAMFVLKGRRREVYGDKTEVEANLKVSLDKETIDAISALV